MFLSLKFLWTCWTHHNFSPLLWLNFFHLIVFSYHQFQKWAKVKWRIGKLEQWNAHSYQLGLFSLLLLYCTLLYYALMIVPFFFNQLKVSANLVSSKSTGANFLTAFSHFMSLSTFGNSHYISEFLIIITVDSWVTRRLELLSPM